MLSVLLEASLPLLSSYCAYTYFFRHGKLRFTHVAAPRQCVSELIEVAKAQGRIDAHLDLCPHVAYSLGLH